MQQIELNITEEITRLHSELCGLAISSVEKAARIGELLTQKRLCCQHGEWMPWVESLPFSRKTAWNYMHVFNNKSKCVNITHLGVSEAYRLLSEPAEEPQFELPDSKPSEPAQSESEQVVVEEVEHKGAGEPNKDSEPEQKQEEKPAEKPKPKPKRMAACVSLEHYKTLTHQEQNDVIALKPEYNAVFNYQDNDNIEWARWSWNPVTGCNHGCDYCYARDIANRFTDAFPHGFAPAFYSERLAAPSKTKPKQELDTWTDVDRMGHRNVFTCSMADLFGKWVPYEWIEAVLGTVTDNPQWNFLFLSKFPQRMQEFVFPPNAWVGTSVDTQGAVARAERAFDGIRAKVKWLSCEPMMERLTFKSLHMFDWVVIGGASKSSQTPAFNPHFEWIAHLVNQCNDSGAKVYMKSNLFGDTTRVRQYPL